MIKNFKDSIKDDLRILTLELDIEMKGKMSVYELKQTLKNFEKYQHIYACNDLATSIFEARKDEDSKLLEFEKIKLETSKNELELARFRAVHKRKMREILEKKLKTLFL